MKRLNTFTKIILGSILVVLVNGCFLGTNVVKEVTNENVTKNEVSTNTGDEANDVKVDINSNHYLTAGAIAAISDTVVAEPVIVESTEDTVEVITAQDNEVYIVAEPIEEEYIIEVPSVKIRIDNKHIDTDVITVNVDKLMEVYYSSAEVKLDWDYKDKPEVWMTVWEFLVNQQNVDPIYASAILGNVAHEGWFGMEQGSYRIFKNMDDVRSKLGKGGRGYGIVQWTYHTRQDNILAYYEAVNQFELNWETTMIIAECCCLLQEIKAYGYFDDLSNADIGVELATGILAVKYESYSGVYDQWYKVPGGYKLAYKGCNGGKRLDYAWKIYYHYGGN